MSQPPRFVTFRRDGVERYGIVAGDGITDLTRPDLPTLREVIAAGARAPLLVRAGLAVHRAKGARAGLRRERHGCGLIQ